MDMKVGKIYTARSKYAGLSFKLQPQLDRLPELSVQEWKVFCYAAHGVPNKIIADELGLFVTTVKQYRYNIKDKLQLTGNRAKMVPLAIELGVVALPDAIELDRLQQSYQTLTPQEKYIMRLIAGGDVMPTIVDKTHYTEGTIRNYRSLIYEKMDIHTIAELTRAHIALEAARKEALETTPSNKNVTLADQPLLQVIETASEATHTVTLPAALSASAVERLDAERRQAQTRAWIFNG